MELEDNHTLSIPRLFLKDMEIVTSSIREFDTFSIYNPKEPIDYEVLYLHGGAYARGIKLHHIYLMRSFAMQLKARVTMIDYPLAPQHEALETTDVCMELYRKISDETVVLSDESNETKNGKNREIILIGDSAGAGLALALSMMIRDYNAVLSNEGNRLIAPSKLILYSPWLDVGMSNPTIQEYEDKDYILDYKALVDIGRAYAGALDIEDFRVSPGFGNLEGLGAICVFYGTEEMFYPDCKTFAKKRGITGTTIHGIEYPKMPHDWLMLPIEEREWALNQTVRFIQGQEDEQMQKQKQGKKRQKDIGTWRRLDNTAHVFPLISNTNYSNVFRVSVVLKKYIDPDLLQKAFEETLQWFPHFQSRIRKGVFWYYFEKNHHPVFQVEQERARPCSYIDRRKNNQYLFKVFYYRKRLTLEVFHVLTDGTGAMKFLKALTANYLRLCQGESTLIDSDVVDTLGDIEDSYKRHYKKHNKKAVLSEKKLDKAYYIKGKKLEMYQMGVIHGHLNVKALSAVAKANNLTITVYLTTVYLWAIYKSEHLEKTKHASIRLAVPVNLRPYFESTTSMNFYSFITVSLDAREDEWSFEELAESVREQFAEQIQKEAFEKRIAQDVKKSKNMAVRLVPRVIKFPIVKAVYRKSLRTYTSTLSNIGKITMPENFAQHIQHFEMMLSPTKTGRIKLGIAGFENELILSFTSQLEDTRIQRYFFRHLTADGLEVKIESNGVYYEDM